jgi:ribosomal protein L33
MLTNIEIPVHIEKQGDKMKIASCGVDVHLRTKEQLKKTSLIQKVIKNKFCPACHKKTTFACWIRCNRKHPEKSGWFHVCNLCKEEFKFGDLTKFL